MVVFVSEYASQDTLSDGMMQRIAAVDSVFTNEPRVYLQIAFKHYFRRQVRQEGLVRIEYVNFFRHYGHIRRCFRDAACVYVHTVHQVLRSLPHVRRFGQKTVVDVHGAVPEEVAYLGKPVYARICQRMERAAVKHARLLVLVTRKMAQHFCEKYSGLLVPAKILVLPMFDSGSRLPPPLPRAANQRSGLRLIYAGGVHKWQNIDLMLTLLSRLATVRPEARTWIYVPREATAEVKRKVTSLGLDERVTVGWLPHGRLLREYARMDAGFVLRDGHLLNQVALPTKLLEYLAYGVVPIVLNPDIGDFLEFGYRYLTTEDLLDPRRLSPENLEQIRRVNAGIPARLEAQRAEGIRTLRELAGLRVVEPPHPRPLSPKGARGE